MMQNFLRGFRKKKNHLAKDVKFDYFQDREKNTLRKYTTHR